MHWQIAHPIDVALVCIVTLSVAVQLSQRFWNSHAMINMAVWLRKEQPSLASALGSKLGVRGGADPPFTQVRVVIGSPREELGGMPVSMPFAGHGMYTFLLPCSYF